MPQSTKAIRSRIKSVEGTKQITRAMELVAASKMRHARETLEKIRPYFLLLGSLAEEVMEHSSDFSSPFCRKHEGVPMCHVVIAGDRGLSGGYNANLFKSLDVDEGDYVIPIGKKALDFFVKRNVVILDENYKSAENIRMKDCTRIAELLAEEYGKGKFGGIDVHYTRFVNVLDFVPERKELLPFVYKGEKVKRAEKLTIYEPSPEAVFEKLVHRYVAGIIYGGVGESVLSELNAVRNAMQSANKNADEMIENLTLEYNRLRQGAITGEITEIAAGSYN